MDRFVVWLRQLHRRIPGRPFQRSLRWLYEAYWSGAEHGGKKVLATRGGIRFELDLAEAIDSSIFLDGCYEPATAEVIEQLCRRGMTVFDIGANVGCHTLRMAKLVGDRGQVVAFEPMSWAASKLRRNLELNKFGNVVLERMALTDRPSGRQVAQFRTSWQQGGNKRNVGSIGDDLVMFTTVDQYMAERHIPGLDLAKIDVDGYELKVVTGAAETLRRHQPVLILELCAYTLREQGATLDDLLGYLDALGYKFYAEQGLVVCPDLRRLAAQVPVDGNINVVASVREL